MRQFFNLALLLSFIILLASCVTTPMKFNPKFTHETWKQEIQIDANRWKVGASRWFLLGEPNHAEMANRRTGARGGITTTFVRTGNFRNIQTNGNFQLQIFGSATPSVYVYGPNNGTQAVSVNVSGDTLIINQTQTVPIEVMERVIVRVGVKCLNNLTQLGAGTIEAIHIASNDLCISSSGSGAIYIAGRINLSEVTLSGTGCVYIFGAKARNLKIVTTGTGVLNMSGNIGLKSITHHGSGDINIIGAYSDGLYIDTDGSGKIAICGIVNLCSICAKDDTCVYIYEVRGYEGIKVDLYGNARVGLAGMTNSLNVQTCGNARFYGKYLCARTAYVRAGAKSHVNVSAATRTFAAATNSATIYFYGPKDAIESFTSEYANIFSMPELRSCMWYHYRLNSAHYAIEKRGYHKRRHYRRKEIMRPGEG